ncbi:hypothetical protein Pmani_037710 [Petrolisthes manimaculis]|uniref:Uncharacterized protein n=1 Tax=Petrolisthes manimaculis TaxID=1843537 RepID=A0AAE1TN10_9EUCA|nr:hypothetical protein Pmani_037710 [Petrolisthes manimaculis]
MYTLISPRPHPPLPSSPLFALHSVNLTAPPIPPLALHTFNPIPPPTPTVSPPPPPILLLPHLTLHTFNPIPPPTPTVTPPILLPHLTLHTFNPIPPPTPTVTAPPPPPILLLPHLTLHTLNPIPPPTPTAPPPHSSNAMTATTGGRVWWEPCFIPAGCQGLRCRCRPSVSQGVTSPDSRVARTAILDHLSSPS